MDDFLPIKSIDHVELYVGNARQAAHYYRTAFGFALTAYSGLETKNRERASYVLEQGKIRLLLSTALSPDHPIARHVYLHGDGVGIIALEVPDAAGAYRETTKRGATGTVPPTQEEDEHGLLRYSAIRSYGDTLIKFVDRSDYNGPFAPGYIARTLSGNGASSAANGRHQGYGLAHIDHIVGNVELGAMNRWVEFFATTMGFSQLIHFDDQDISTEYSALMSKVMQDGTGKVKFPINEPAEGKKKSQIQEYLDYYYGPGVQHIALSTGDIIEAVTRLRDSGVEFLRVPTTYYEELEARVGKINEPVDQLAELGILVDRDDEGYLLQIFTRPVEDRPTLFYEIIERHGSRGFGKGNFKALFEAIEREQALRGNL
ncbi:MAG: 4-hydroxyphenylpyruvate dioxygenase [Chloroflexi bacterium]|nr:4-hydroxyphenylpyruvate dioxygenase [Chloroflexota bacterium]MCI0578933.1 4-hydroxyphenylpyruvate dioxygenase [Chloroflexota bacterium]MCI0646870.1 4-hydroxyphenylpyruvate dioxygenase [Chloroflexota bacterium]MCI0730812.1 4-hydroxyphenylpyruvate dioxygenase [Chloroflexota bacterium]